MKKNILFLTVLLFVAPSLLQAQDNPQDSVLPDSQLDVQVQEIPKNTFKKDRYIYLWDVTVSMQGKVWNSTSKKYDYVKEADIYDQVVEEIVRDINSITDETTEIVVIPFQSASPNSYQSTNNPWICETASGPNKQALIDKIRSSKKDWLKYAHGNTDVVPALSYVIGNIISDDRIDYLKILTDGKMADMDGLRSLMAKWCELASKKKGMHAFYISLNQEASESIQAIIRDAQQQGCFKIRKPGPDPLAFFQVIPYPSIPVNCNDQLASSSPAVNVQLQVKGPGKLPDSFKVRFQAEDNPLLEVDNSIIQVKDNAFTLQLRFKTDMSGFKNTIHTGMKYPVKLYMIAENSDNVYLLENTVTLYLTLERQKKLTISWE